MPLSIRGPLPVHRFVEESQMLLDRSAALELPCALLKIPFETGTTAATLLAQMCFDRSGEIAGFDDKQLLVFLCDWPQGSLEEAVQTLAPGAADRLLAQSQVLTLRAEIMSTLRAMVVPAIPLVAARMEEAPDPALSLSVQDAMSPAVQAPQASSGIPLRDLLDRLLASGSAMAANDGLGTDSPLATASALLADSPQSGTPANGLAPSLVVSALPVRRRALRVVPSLADGVNGPLDPVDHPVSSPRPDTQVTSSTASDPVPPAQTRSGPPPVAAGFRRKRATRL